MKKEQFLTLLRKKLRGLPSREVEERINFYSETICDRIEEGCTEEEAVRAAGDINAVAEQIRCELTSAKSESNGKNTKSWEILLLVLGSPIWLSLLIVAFAVAITLYAVMWSLIVVLWAAEAPLYIFSIISKYLLKGSLEATKGAFAFTKKSASLLLKPFKMEKF